MDCVTTRLMREISKCMEKEKEIQDEDVAIMLGQSKGGKSFPRQSVKLYFDCGKPGHIARFYYKT